MNYEPLPSTPIDLPQERYEQIIDEIERSRGDDDPTNSPWYCGNCGQQSSYQGHWSVDKGGFDCKPVKEPAFDPEDARQHYLGWLRYEALRKLNARQYAELCDRNLRGENFDGMVDELVEGGRQ